MRFFGKMPTVTLAVFFLASSLWGCKDSIKPGRAEGKGPEVRGVTVARVVPSAVESFYETSGAVKAKATVPLASRVFGTVAKLYAKEGDRVNAGAILLAIDDLEATQRVNAAESGYREAVKARETAEKQFNLADITYKRYSNLYKDKVVTAQEFDQVETRKNVANLDLERASLATNRAKALLEEAKVSHDYTKIRAPFSGLVTAKKVEPGTMAIPGMHLMTVEDTSRFKVEAYVDERLSHTLKTGMPVIVRLEATGKSVPASITRIVPAIDPATRTFAIEAEIKEPSLKSGLFSKVFIPDGKREAILVPPSAVVTKGQLTGVYIVDGKGVIGYRLVRTGKSFDRGVEILSGLGSGERIIIGGMEKAVEGGLVKDQSAPVQGP